MLNRKLIDFIMKKLSIKDNYSIESEKYQVVEYMLSCIIFDFEKTLILFVISCFLSYQVEFILFTVSLFIARQFSFGLHVENNFICTLIGIITTSISLYGSIHLKINLIKTLVIFFICYIINLFFAPSSYGDDNFNKAEIKILKIKTLGILLINLVMILLIRESSYRNAVLFGVIIETVYILPFNKLSFKRYNN